MKAQLKKLDRLIVRGEILNAFEKFFAEEVVTHSNAGDKSFGKDQKRDFLRGFFSNMSDTKKIELHDQVIDDNVTYSSFTFEFVNKQGEHLVWNETIQRTWHDNLVVEEYYSQQDIEKIRETVTKKGKEVKKEKDEGKESDKKIKEVPHPDANRTIQKEPKKPSRKTANSKKQAVTKPKKANAKPDNLKKVEGIGPKIEQLLRAENITSFQDLAQAKTSVLQKVLHEAGPRFRMHSPATWAEQAKLLANGKIDELTKLQEELKGGRKV